MNDPIKFCPACNKMEKRSECAFGTAYFDKNAKAIDMKEGTARERFLQSLKRSGFDAREKHKQWSDTAKKMEQKRKEIEKQYPVKEDAPANVVGGGQIAGVGVGPQGEPGVKKRKTASFISFLKRKSNVAA